MKDERWEEKAMLITTPPADPRAGLVRLLKDTYTAG
jgi:hypothetical protein